MWTSTLKKGLFLIGGLFLGGAVHAQYLRKYSANYRY